MWAVLDTSVYVGHFERGLYQETLELVRKTYVVRHAAVVLSELRRGARTREAQRTVMRLHRLARDPWVPSGSDWWEAGRLILAVGDAQGWDLRKRRDFQNDVLIALTARRHGATVVTANRDDFGLLAGRLPLSLQFV